MNYSLQCKKYVWNTIGSTSNVLLSVVLLILTNRIVGQDAGGVLSFEYL